MDPKKSARLKQRPASIGEGINKHRPAQERSVTLNYNNLTQKAFSQGKKCTGITPSTTGYIQYLNAKKNEPKVKHIIHPASASGRAAMHHQPHAMYKDFVRRHFFLNGRSNKYFRLRSKAPVLLHGAAAKPGQASVRCTGVSPLHGPGITLMLRLPLRNKPSPSFQLYVEIQAAQPIRLVSGCRVGARHDIFTGPG